MEASRASRPIRPIWMSAFLLVNLLPNLFLKATRLLPMSLKDWQLDLWKMESANLQNGLSRLQICCVGGWRSGQDCELEKKQPGCYSFLPNPWVNPLLAMVPL